MKDKIIQALFETAIECGLHRNHIKALRDTLTIVAPEYDQAAIQTYYDQQAGGQSDHV